jgi:hypothetical protein
MREVRMILKVTVLKSGDDIFSVHIDVRDQAELSTGVKAALDELQRLRPKTKLLGGDVLIMLDKVKAELKLPKLSKTPKAPSAPKSPKAPKVRKKALAQISAPATAPALAPEMEAEAELV